MDDTLETKAGRITIKYDRVTGGAPEEQKQFKMKQMAEDALVNLIVAIIRGKEK